MTDQDNLRGRIGGVVFASLLECHDYGSQSRLDREEYVAQAIIDEFELTTETHAATHSKRAMTRIIGAWEWDNQ